MAKVLLLVSSDWYLFPLVRYLALESRKQSWKTNVGSMFGYKVPTWIQQEFSDDLTFTEIADHRQCAQTIRKTDVVIGMLPAEKLLQVADNCITYGKNLISPSSLNRQMAARKAKAEKNGVLLLMECGFSPGLDHITAKMAIDNIHSKKGKIISFKTYSGSLPAESSTNNTWQFKLTEPTHDIINMGKYNNRHLINGQLQHIPHHQLFKRTEPITIPNMNNIVAVPEGDALYYRKVYQLTEADTVIKGRFFRKGFDSIWDLIINLGLTDHISPIDMIGEKSFIHFLNSLLPYSKFDFPAGHSKSIEYRLMKYTGVDEEEIEKLKWLGLFDEKWMGRHKKLTPAAILRYLLEKKFTPEPEDKDCIIMQHQLEYMHNNIQYRLIATLNIQGEDPYDSAIAQVVGLTTGAAAKAVLSGMVTQKGLHIPTRHEIYNPILNELYELGVAFHIEEEKIKDVNVNEMVDA